MKKTLKTIIVVGVIAIALAGAYLWMHRPSEPISSAQIAERTDTQPPATEDTATPAPSYINSPLLGIQEYDKPLGDPNAPVTIVEYASLSCHHCAHFHTTTLPVIKEHYLDTGKAKLLFRDFPLNEAALAASKLTHCVAEDRYHEMLGLLFDTQKDWAFSEEYAKDLQQKAVLAGMKPEEFTRCMQDKELEKQLLITRQQAEQEFGVSSTPTLIVNGAVHKGARSFEHMAQAIDQALAQAE